jgi:hypothetical protein
VAIQGRRIRRFWGAGPTASKMAECRRLKSVTVAQFEFVEWTGDNHLRHTSFNRS